MKKIAAYSSGFILLFLFLTPMAGFGQDFVYQPTNPAFGGNYLNYSWLLNSAKAQNKFQSTPDYSFNENPLDNFKQSLQRQILSTLTQKVLQNRFGDIDLSKKSSYQFGEFSINIVPGGEGVDINIADNNNNKQTTVTIPNF
jgi:curli production assembly/transport component CsgF